ncbi:MAG: hypothetical protein WC975_02590 [Phycisphaerae bacterium]
MNCQNIRQIWSDQIDGHAVAGASDAVKVHLDECADCRRYCRQMTNLDEALGYLRQISEHRASVAKSPGKWQIWFPPLVRIAAVLALAAGTIFYLARPHQAAQEKPTHPRIVAQRQAGEKIAPNTAPAGEPKTNETIQLAEVSAQNMLAVQCPTANPRVHLFKLYPIMDGSKDKNF